MQRHVRTAFICILGIGFFLLSLWFIPKIFTRSHFSFDLGSTPLEKVPLDTLLSLLNKGNLPLNKPTASLQELLKLKDSILVNFWATWCAPCIEELPSLELLYRELKDRNDSLPGLVTISVDEKKEAVFELYQSLDFRPTFPVLHDSSGDLAKAWGTTKFPETYWILKDGTIRTKWVGPQNWMTAGVLGALVERE